MRFGKTLQKAIYPPWKDKYLDYAKLKRLIREEASSRQASRDASEDEDQEEWTAEDEEAFMHELIGVQLEKVTTFQTETYKNLRDRTSECEVKLEPLSIEPKEGEGNIEASRRTKALEDILKDLDSITKETSELEKYSRINFTGFYKAAKKHDRKRGLRYRARPMLQVRLSQRPFNTEDYSPLLYRLSAMYSFVRQRLYPGGEGRADSVSESRSERDTYTSHKFWVHTDNLLELKTYILRRLPVLVYNPQSSKVVDSSQKDPSITSIYFDNPKFELYTEKVDKAPEAGSLRLRWTGQLGEKPEIYLEKKVVSEAGDSKEIKFQIKEKYIQAFLKGEYKMEKQIQKLKERSGEDAAKVLDQNVVEIQDFIRERKLEPVLRASYNRTAFQIPGDNRVRISLDTDVAFIREDALDPNRPCRDPDDWHRRDVDDNALEYPFISIKKGEIYRFPHALLEIKVKDSTKRNKEWLEDLMSSYLIKEEPRFSKFVHGVASLFEDYVNSFPFWLNDLETDIRRDPKEAFEQEQQKQAKRQEDEFAVGSYLGTKPSPSPALKSSLASKALAREHRPASHSAPAGTQLPSTTEEHDSDDDGLHAEVNETGDATSRSGLRAFLPAFSTSRYARARRQGRENAPLPPGVRDPGVWIKDSGPVKVEAKVWLANQRTFIKWQHIAVLLASLSLGLYNAAGVDNNIARSLAVAYTICALFAGVWGWWMYLVRSKLIQERSGKDFDNRFGPIVVCLGLAIALCANFGFKVRICPFLQKASI